MTESTPVAPVPLFAFDSFQMDISRYRLSRGRREIPLRRKSGDVRRHLRERAGFLVTKDAIHRDVWPDVAVSDDALTKSIAELRRALGDTRSRARYIETVHGRGFRFIAEVREIRAVRPEPKPGPNAAPVITREADARFVGRQSEIERLGECLRRAGQRERQLVFITGEAGIGKTTLAEAFLHSRDVRAPDVLVLHGQCIKQRGQREPYMPVLEALERVLSAPVGAELVPLFRRVAPCWYVQIPRLLSEGEPAGFQAAMMTAPPERMLREIGAFLESAAGRSTIVLLLEDLHWSDNATADLLSFLAERRDPARLLVIGTFRPAEASTHEHPIREVRQTLRAHRRCVDLALDYLSTSEVAEYLRDRFGKAMEKLAALVHHRTDGNPLFVVALVEELIRREQLVRTDRGWVSSAPPDRLELAIPEGLLEMVSMQFQSLPADERLLLEAASVVGATFTPATVARTVGREAEGVDAVSQQMVRAHLFLSASAGGTGDRTPALRYEFAHALHHQVIYEQIPRLRRQRLHLQVAEALESTSGERLPEVAPELSVHFEQGGEPFRAAKYLHMCVARAQQRQAQHEAIACAELALDLLERVPDSAERRQSELDLRLLLGVSLNLTRGFSARAVRDNYERALRERGPRAPAVRDRPRRVVRADGRLEVRGRPGEHRRAGAHRGRTAGARVPVARRARPRPHRVLERTVPDRRPSLHAVPGRGHEPPDRAAQRAIRRRARAGGIRARQPRALVPGRAGSRAGMGAERDRGLGGEPGAVRPRLDADARGVHRAGVRRGRHRARPRDARLADRRRARGRDVRPAEPLFPRRRARRARKGRRRPGRDGARAGRASRGCWLARQRRHGRPARRRLRAGRAMGRGDRAGR